MIVIFHKHLILNATITHPIKDEDKAQEFLTNLVTQISMKPLITPVARYVDTPGNRGMTGAILIETSHIAFHIWDEYEPGRLRFDLYTCGTLDHDQVYRLVDEQFGIVTATWWVLDRESDITFVATGQYSHANDTK
jgi:S-adenosylmethionine/arginine decarboxylase-like enzyme